MAGASTSLLWDNSPRLLEITRMILTSKTAWSIDFSEEELEVLAPLIWGTTPTEAQKNLLAYKIDQARVHRNTQGEPIEDDSLLNGTPEELFNSFLQQINNWLNGDEIDFIKNSWEARTSRIKELIRQRDEARASALAANARQISMKDNTIALNLAMAAYQLAQTEESVGALHDILSDPSSVFYEKNSQFSEIPNLIDFSPDGQQIITAAYDNIVKLWDLQGNLIQTFEGHNSNVEQVAFDPAGELLLTSSRSNQAILWRIDGTVVKTFEHSSSEWGPFVRAVAFSRVNELILTVDSEKDITLWNLNGEFVRDFSDDSDTGVLTGYSSATSATFSKDGQYILTGKLTTIRLWDKDTGFVRSFIHDSQVRSIAISPHGNHILTGTMGNDLLLWEKTPETNPRKFPGHGGPVTAVAFSPDEGYLLSGSSDTIVRLWKLDGTLVHAFTAHTGEIKKVAFTADGKYCMSSSYDGTVKSWELQRIKNQTIFPKDNSEASVNLAFPPGDKDLIAEFWGLGARSPVLEDKLRQTYNGTTSTLALSKDGKSVLIGFENKAHLWNFDGEFIHTFAGHTSAITCAALSFDGQYILIARGNSTARLWKRTEEQVELVEVLDDHSSVIDAATFSHDNLQLITAARTPNVKLWNIDGKLIRTLPKYGDYITVVVFSPDGRYFLTSGSQGLIRLWDIDGNFIWSMPRKNSYTKAITFSSDGKYILVEEPNEGVSLWNINGKRLQTINIDGHIRAVAFSATGRDLLICYKNWAALKSRHILGDWDNNFIYKLSIEDRVKYKIDELGIEDNITGRIADNIYRRLTLNEKKLLRFIMLRLVNLQNGIYTSRRGYFTEYLGDGPGENELDHPSDAQNYVILDLLNRMKASQLVITAFDWQGKFYIEPAHDSLVNHWEKCLQWIDEFGENNILLQRNLWQAASNWSHNWGDPTLELLWNNKPQLLELTKTILDLKQQWLPDADEHVIRTLAPLIWDETISEDQQMVLNELSVQWQQNEELPQLLIQQFLAQIDRWLNNLETKFVRESWAAWENFTY